MGLLAPFSIITYWWIRNGNIIYARNGISHTIHGYWKSIIVYERIDVRGYKSCTLVIATQRMKIAQDSNQLMARHKEFQIPN